MKIAQVSPSVFSRSFFVGEFSYTIDLSTKNIFHLVMPDQLIGSLHQSKTFVESLPECHRFFLSNVLTAENHEMTDCV